MKQTLPHTQPGQNDKSFSTQTGEHELKFVFPLHRVASVLQWLKHLCRPDPKFPCDIVSTIYYDTHDRRFLREKLNSDYLKTKVRIRWYTAVGNNQQTDLSWLEIKQKIGAQRQKFGYGFRIQVSGYRPCLWIILFWQTFRRSSLHTELYSMQ